VRGIPPEGLDYRGVAKPLLGVWLAVCTGFGDLLDRPTLADVIAATMRPCPPVTTPAHPAWSTTPGAS
jgi:hypothetical protein